MHTFYDTIGRVELVLVVSSKEFNIFLWDLKKPDHLQGPDCRPMLYLRLIKFLAKAFSFRPLEEI